MNLDPSIISALPAADQKRPLGKTMQPPNPVSAAELNDPSVLSALPSSATFNGVGIPKNNLSDPCVVAAQPIAGGSIMDKSSPKQQMQQLALQYMAAQMGQNPRQVQMGVPQAAQVSTQKQHVSPASLQPLQAQPVHAVSSSLPLEIAQQQLQQQQHLARMIQLQRQHQQVPHSDVSTPQVQVPMAQQLQQLQMQQLLQQQLHLQQQQQQGQQLLLQQQQLKAQQLQMQQRQQLLLQGQQPIQQLSQQQMLLYDQQQLAQLQPHQLQQLHQQLQQQIQLHLQQQQQQQQQQQVQPQTVDLGSVLKLGSTQNGVPVEPGVYGFPAGAAGLPQQLATATLAAGAQAIQNNYGLMANAMMGSTQGPLMASAVEGAAAAAAAAGNSFMSLGAQAQNQMLKQLLLAQPQGQEQQQGSSLQDQRLPQQRQSRQHDHNQMQYYASQESSFERPTELDKASLVPIRRATKALEIVDPKTNTVIQLTKPEAQGTEKSPEGQARLNGSSKAIPIIDPKTNAPIHESAAGPVVMSATETVGTPEKPTVNSPYTTTPSP